MFIPSHIYHLARSSGTYKKRRRGQSVARRPTVWNPHARCNDACIDIDALLSRATVTSRVYATAEPMALGKLAAID